ncbi:MAG TPA: hypothetical protein VHF23_07985, partial [Gaiellaceae bacterium]|nr:hypothetical protein [Gaiellaceae bacterium]
MSSSSAGGPGRAGRGVALTWIVLGAVAVIAAAAALDALRRDPEPARVEAREETGRLTGEGVPEPGALAGRLVFTSLGECRPQVLRLETLMLDDPGPSLECGLWVAPRADLAAVSLAPALGLRGSRVALLRLTPRPTLLESLGVVRGEPSWSPDGERLAWCTAAGETV